MKATLLDTLALLYAGAAIASWVLVCGGVALAVTLQSAIIHSSLATLGFVGIAVVSALERRYKRRVREEALRLMRELDDELEREGVARAGD